MASRTLTLGETFPDGTTVGAYPASAWAGLHPSGDPTATVAATNEQDIADSVVTFTGLAEGTDYYAVGQTEDETWRYIGFATTPPHTGSADASAVSVVGFEDPYGVSDQQAWDDLVFTQVLDNQSAIADLPATMVGKVAFTEKGYILVGTGAGSFAALEPGTDGQILAADSTEPTGVKWVDPA
jgi:hypothetical protein